MNRTALLQDRQIEKVKELLKRWLHVLQKAGQLETALLRAGAASPASCLLTGIAQKRGGR
jgi:hypothetical protein